MNECNCPECGEAVPEEGLCWDCFEESELFEPCAEVLTVEQP